MAHAERAAKATQLRSLAGETAERPARAGALTDRRPQAAAQRAAIDAVAASPAAATQRQAFDSLAGGAAQLRAQGVLQAAAPEEDALQMQAPEEELLQGAGLDEEEPLQGAGLEEDELQMKAAPEGTAAGAKANQTGLPDGLKGGVEALSGMSLDDVKVHYNSDRPAQMNALAYAQGAEIHIGAGQEKHLPHEAWHVVQQAQGRVAETRQMRGGIGVNDDPSLEQEADQMGARALAAATPEMER